MVKRKKLPPEAMNGHKKVGGTRVGAGRKHGSLNKQSKKFKKMAEASGMVFGHVFMLQVLNAGIKGKQVAGFTVTWEDMKWAAEKCANYFAPRLQSTQVQATVQQVTFTAEQLSKLTTEELRVAEKLLGKLGGTQEEAPKPNAEAAALYAATLGSSSVH